MALLTTSCTMRNKPSRLLDKGPDYLRTKTNSEMFANRRKSAVELLAASRPRYVKSAAVLDSSAGLTASTPDRHYRSICQPREKPPTRSKSEFDISKLQWLLAQDDSDTSDSALDVQHTGHLSQQDLSRRDEEREEAGQPTTPIPTPRIPRRDREKGEAGQPAPIPTPRTQKRTEEKGDAGKPTPTPRTLTTQIVTPAGPSESGVEKIDSEPDRQDESQRLCQSKPDVSATATPSLSSTSTGGSHSATPAVYTARPVFINITHSYSKTGPPTAPKPHSNGAGLAPGNRSSRVPTAASRLLSPAAMSEESSDKTPTNPTGGDMTPGLEDPVSTPVQVDVPPTPPATETRDVVTAPVTSGETVTTITSNTNSSPGPRFSLRNSGEFMSGMSGFSPVPRSFSDISCRHSHAGSDVSSDTSRTSRASTGANLEKFFNEMGMERDILDPMIQLQQKRFGGSELDIYESLSSLESHDARSICSALSRSEKEISEAESFERNQQQTSVIERNARIIKWLCSIKKAKAPAATVQGSAAS